MAVILVNKMTFYAHFPNKQEHLCKKGSDFISFLKNVFKLRRKVPKPSLICTETAKNSKKTLKKWLLFSCVFIFAGTVDDSVFCNHFSWMSKLVIFGYPIATPFRKSRSDIWNVVRFFCIADNVYPTPLFNQGDVICEFS